MTKGKQKPNAVYNIYIAYILNEILTEKSSPCLQFYNSNYP